MDGGNVIGEVTGDETYTYVRGVNLIFGRARYYLYNAHGDVVQLTNTNGQLTKNYNYDAFGNERSPDEEDVNPFRYCGEYYDTETGLYYLRARYYDPLIGRFTQEDTHWNTANMIYGDNPQKINEREDALGLKTYSYAPQLSAVVQSGNLYAYCGSNPVSRVDPTGKAWYHWALGGLIVVAAAAAVVVSAGSVLPALYAVGAVANGIAAGSVASTVAAGVFIGSSIAYGTAVLNTAMDSNSAADFANRGNWWVIEATTTGATVGLIYGSVLNKESFLNSLKFKRKSFQHGYKHAADYGITGNWNKANAAAFEQAIRNHIKSVVNPISGTYRGTPVYHFYDPQTGLNTMIDLNGKFVGGWILGAEQIWHLMHSGNIN